MQCRATALVVDENASIVFVSFKPRSIQERPKRLPDTIEISTPALENTQQSTLAPAEDIQQVLPIHDYKASSHATSSATINQTDTNIDDQKVDVGNTAESDTNKSDNNSSDTDSDAPIFNLSHSLPPLHEDGASLSTYNVPNNLGSDSAASPVVHKKKVNFKEDVEEFAPSSNLASQPEIQESNDSSEENDKNGDSVKDAGDFEFEEEQDDLQTPSTVFYVVFNNLDKRVMESMSESADKWFNSLQDGIEVSTNNSELTIPENDCNIDIASNTSSFGFVTKKSVRSLMGIQADEPAVSIGAASLAEFWNMFKMSAFIRNLASEDTLSQLQAVCSLRTNVSGSTYNDHMMQEMDKMLPSNPPENSTAGTISSILSATADERDGKTTVATPATNQAIPSQNDFLNQVKNSSAKEDLPEDPVLQADGNDDDARYDDYFVMDGDDTDDDNSVDSDAEDDDDDNNDDPEEFVKRNTFRMRNQSEAKNIIDQWRSKDAIDYKVTWYFKNKPDRIIDYGMLAASANTIMREMKEDPVAHAPSELKSYAVFAKRVDDKRFKKYEIPIASIMQQMSLVFQGIPLRDNIIRRVREDISTMRQRHWRQVQQNAMHLIDLLKNVMRQIDDLTTGITQNILSINEKGIALFNRYIKNFEIHSNQWASYFLPCVDILKDDENAQCFVPDTLTFLSSSLYEDVVTSIMSIKNVINDMLSDKQPRAPSQEEDSKWYGKLKSAAGNLRVMLTRIIQNTKNAATTIVFSGIMSNYVVPPIGSWIMNQLDYRSYFGVSNHIANLLSKDSLLSANERWTLMMSQITPTLCSLYSIGLDIHGGFVENMVSRAVYAIFAGLFVKVSLDTLNKIFGRATEYVKQAAASVSQKIATNTLIGIMCSSGIAGMGVVASISPDNAMAYLRNMVAGTLATFFTKSACSVTDQQYYYHDKVKVARTTEATRGLELQQMIIERVRAEKVDGNGFLNDMIHWLTGPRKVLDDMMAFRNGEQIKDPDAAIKVQRLFDNFCTIKGLSSSTITSSVKQMFIDFVMAYKDQNRKIDGFEKLKSYLLTATKVGTAAVASTRIRPGAISKFFGGVAMNAVVNILPQGNATYGLLAVVVAVNILYNRIYANAPEIEQGSRDSSVVVSNVIKALTMIVNSYGPLDFDASDEIAD